MRKMIEQSDHKKTLTEIDKSVIFDEFSASGCGNKKGNINKAIKKYSTHAIFIAMRLVFDKKKLNCINEKNNRNKFITLANVMYMEKHENKNNVTLTNSVNIPASLGCFRIFLSVLFFKIFILIPILTFQKVHL
jgi:hypothetical protein